MAKSFDIKTRSYEYALRLTKFVMRLPKDSYSYILGRQLLRSGTSVAANIEEADGTLTKADYVYTMNLSRKEAKESRLWLRLIKDVSLSVNQNDLEWLLLESEEIIKILSRIILNKRKT